MCVHGIVAMLTGPATHVGVDILDQKNPLI
jgi:hypothetical protein